MPWVESDSEAILLHPVTDQDWEQLAAAYAPAGSAGPGRPLLAVLGVAREGGCQTVVVEHRYIDLDFRSEHSAFWSLRFEVPSPFTRRLHFFSSTLEFGELHKLPAEPGYLGYAVLRPIDKGRVGRTFLAPPPRLAGATITAVEETVSLFGNDLRVEGVPFCEQDAEYLRCAHAAAWVCHYIAVRRDLVGRRATSSLVDLTPDALSQDRALPSKGLTLHQLQAVFGALGQPAIHYGFSSLPNVSGVRVPTAKTDADGTPIAPGFWDTRCISIICRYLNSGFPVLVAGDGHAWVLVGWRRDEAGDVVFIACDDQIGPYEEIPSPFAHYRSPWHSIMVPLPPKVFLPAEAAESNAHLTLRGIWSASEQTEPLADALAAGDIQLRTRLKSVRKFKREVEAQTGSDEVLRAIRMTQLPNFVWVVEAHDKAACHKSDCVVATVLYDSTSSDHAPRCALIAIPGAVAVYPPGPNSSAAVPAGLDRWKSLLPAH